MSDMPERIWIAPVHEARLPDDFYLLDPEYRNGRGTEYVRADKVAALVEAARVMVAGYSADDDRTIAGFYALQSALAALDAKP